MLLFLLKLYYGYVVIRLHASVSYSHWPTTDVASQYFVSCQCMQACPKYYGEGLLLYNFVSLNSW